MIEMDNFSKISPFSNHPMQRLLLFLTLVFFLVSCSPIYISRTEEDFSAIADLEKRIHSEKDVSVQAKYHLQLAWLYSNYKNPKMDYRKALDEFEVYLSMVPEGAQTDEIQNWLSVLRALERSQKEQRLTLEDQAKKDQQLQENIKKLVERNASLEKAIKRLKTLNLEVEKKRKSAK